MQYIGDYPNPGSAADSTPLAGVEPRRILDFSRAIDTPLGDERSLHHAVQPLQHCPSWVFSREEDPQGSFFAASLTPRTNNQSTRYSLDNKYIVRPPPVAEERDDISFEQESYHQHRANHQLSESAVLEEIQRECERGGRLRRLLVCS